VHAQDERGSTPLHFASFAGHLAIVGELVGRGAKLEAKSKYSNTPLHLASFHGHQDVVRFLLDAGEDVEAKTSDDATPFFCASTYGHLEVVRELLARGAAVDARTNDGSTPLIKASEMGHATVVCELLACGAAINTRRYDDAAALHMASYCGHTEALRELLKRDDVNVDAQTDEGSTPLHMDACSEGRLMAPTLLLDRGADLALLDNAGRSALRWAELCVAHDAEPPAVGTEPPTAAQLREHRDLVALLKARGAT
jgi:ankyrin repeat protein